jgi:hypothetical protein
MVCITSSFCIVPELGGQAKIALTRMPGIAYSFGDYNLAKRLYRSILRKDLSIWSLPHRVAEIAEDKGDAYNFVLLWILFFAAADAESGQWSLQDGKAQILAETLYGFYYVFAEV